MSRRREAADLARALLLSTQEATTVSHLSPHCLSSSKSNSQDSKEMELRAVLNDYDSIAGLPPVLGTYTDERRVDQPRMLPPTMDTIVTGGSSSNVPSAIQSFTPTRSNPTPTTVSSHTGPHSSNSKGPSSSDPGLPSSGGGPQQASSFGPKQPSSSTPNHPYSSPGLPIPSSRLTSAQTPSGSGSNGSSHRPLFSPTQLSNPAPPTSSNQPLPPPSSSNPPRPRVSVTYGKQTSPQKTPVRGTSPLEAAGPPIEYHKPLELSDDEVEEAVEQLESHATTDHPPTHTNGNENVNSKSNVEIVLPTRTRPPRSPPREHSPDPLDLNLSRSTSTSVQIPLGKHGAMPSSSKRSSSSIPPESQMSMSSIGGGARISRRVQDQRAKEEAEKEARRAARRARKEKERLEEEAKQKKAKNQVEDESIVPLDVPGSASRSHRKDRRSRVVDPPVVIEIPDDSLPILDPVVQTPNRTRTRGRVQESKENELVTEDHGGKELADLAKPAGSKRKRVVIDDDEDQRDERKGDEVAIVVPEPAEAIKKATPKGKGKGKGKAKDAKVGKKSKLDASEQVADDTVAEEGRGVQVDESADIVMKATELATAASPQKTLSLSPAPMESGKQEDEIEEEEKAQAEPARDQKRSPLAPTSANTPRASSSTHRASPGPSNLPGGIKWKTSRDDLSSVLSKFGGARQSGMSRRYRIAPLHSKIGPPVKSLPPPPPKPSKKKKDEEEDDDDDEDAEMESDGEGGLRRKKKEKGMEWYMVED